MSKTTLLEQAGRYACILFDKAFKVTICREENEELLREIIQLLIPGRRISHLEFNRNENSGLAVSEKSVIFDMICTDADTRAKFIVELQFAEQHSYQDRMLCYATYPIRTQLAEKLKYRKDEKEIDKMDYTLNPTYVVSLVNFSLKHEDAGALENNGLISRYAVRNDGNGELMTDALHFVYLELGRLKYGPDDHEKCQNLLEQFAFSMKYIHTFTERPKGFDDPLLKHLYEATELAQMSIEDREKYDYTMRTWIDDVAEKKFARDKGHEEGRAEAMKEMAKKLLALNVPIATIVEATGLSEEQISTL